MARTDARWLLATRAVLFASGHPCVPSQHRDRLLESAARRGFAPIHGAAIIAIAEQAALRGGLDRTAADQLREIPHPPSGANSNLSMWLSLIIAALVVIAGVIGAIRFL